jgi:ABC-type branched-subunit amino acid transport system ATPase component
MPMAAPRPFLLGVSGLSKRFGRIRALDDVSFTIRRGEVLGLIGPNGALQSSRGRLGHVVAQAFQRGGGCASITFAAVALIRRPTHDAEASALATKRHQPARLALLGPS